MFKDCNEVYPVSTSSTLKKMSTASRRNSWLLSRGWTEAFGTVIDAADQYRITDCQEVLSFQP